MSKEVEKSTASSAQVIISSFEKELKDLEALKLTMPFLEYFNAVLTGKILDLYLSAPHITYQSIMHKGYKSLPTGEKEYFAFSDRTDKYALYGLYAPIEAFVNFVRSGSKDKGVIFIAQSGAGKSTLVDAISSTLVEFTQKYPLYALDGCPIFEHPLNLVPPDTREKLYETYGIRVTEGLCPRCQTELDKSRQTIEEWQVKRLIFSPKLSRCIGKIDPVSSLDSKSIDNIYQEMTRSNRGILEISEFWRHHQEFLKTLNDFFRGRELFIGTERWQLDNLIIAHTTFTEWSKFRKIDDNQTLIGRLEEIFIPLNLSVSSEIKIYEKTIRNGSVQTYSKTSWLEEGRPKEGIHLPKQTLRVLAEIGCTSRYARYDNNPLLTDEFKLAHYDGKIFKGYTLEQITDLTRRLKEETEERLKKDIPGRLADGFVGLSPDFMINELSQIAGGATECANPVWALQRLTDNLSSPTSDLKSYEEWKPKIVKARENCERWLKEVVINAFRDKFIESCQKLFEDYLDNIEAYVNKEKLKDPITEEDTEPDAKLMRSVEEQIGVSENGKKTFREEILIQISTLSRKGITFEYTTNERLKEALEKKIRSETTDPEAILKSIALDEKQKDSLLEAQKRLVSDFDFCRACATELINYTAKHLLDKKL